MDSKQEKFVTVQGLGNPVPADTGSEQAGSRPSISSDRNVMVVDNLASIADINTRKGENMVGDQAKNATGTREEVSNPFMRKGIGRTPPRARLNSSPGALAMQVSTQCVQTPDAQPIEKLEMEDATAKRSQELILLGEQLQDLRNFAMPKHNVHGDIKKKINSISLTYARLFKLDEKVNARLAAPEAHSASTQTSPKPEGPVIPTLEQSSDQNPKRKEISPLVYERKKPREAKRRKKIPAMEQPLKPQQDENQEDTGDKWQTVQRKKRSRPALPNALIIQKKGQLSYAEILSKVKKDETLQEVGLGVEKVRRNFAGDIILVLDKVSQENTTKFQAAIENALGAEATVKSRVQETKLEIKDLDEVTTKDEILGAISRALVDKELKADIIKSLRPAYGGTQTAVVTLPMEAAKKLTDTGKLRVGWVVCRVREMVKPTKCYNCWQYGHISRNCKNNDRSKLCIKCGVEGHKADKCTSEPCCILCRDEGNMNTLHFAGSSRCPAYMKAYQAMIQKRR